MIGKKVIIIVICGLLIFGTISIYKINSIPSNNGNDKKKDNSTEDTITTGGDDEIKNITLNTTTSNDTFEMKTYTLKTPVVNETNCKDIINDLYPMWTDDNITTKAIDNIGIGFNKSDGTNCTETISFTSGGRMDYINHSAERKWDDNLMAILSSNVSVELITKEEAYQLSLEYIKKHGDFPNGSFLFFNNTSTHTTPNGSIINYSYTFSFKRTFDGYLIAGSSGEGLKISVTPLGDVWIYSVLWREIDSIKNKITIKSSSDAVIYLDRHVSMNITIDRIEIGYFSDNSHKIQTELSPVWFFYTGSQNTNYLVVDAVGLGYIK